MKRGREGEREVDSMVKERMEDRETEEERVGKEMGEGTERFRGKGGGENQET